MPAAVIVFLLGKKTDGLIADEDALEGRNPPATSPIIEIDYFVLEPSGGTAI